MCEMEAPYIVDGDVPSKDASGESNVSVPTQDAYCDTESSDTDFWYVSSTMGYEPGVLSFSLISLSNDSLRAWERECELKDKRNSDCLQIHYMNGNRNNLLYKALVLNGLNRNDVIRQMRYSWIVNKERYGDDSTSSANATRIDVYNIFLHALYIECFRRSMNMEYINSCRCRHPALDTVLGLICSGMHTAYQFHGLRINAILNSIHELENRLYNYAREQENARIRATFKPTTTNHTLAAPAGPGKMDSHFKTNFLGGSTICLDMFIRGKQNFIDGVYYTITPSSYLLDALMYALLEATVQLGMNAMVALTTDLGVLCLVSSLFRHMKYH